MRQQRCHTKLRNRGEDALHAFQCNLTLGLTAQLLGQGSCHFVAEGVRNNHIHTIVTGCNLAAVETLLLLHFQNRAVPFQLLGADIGPVGTQLRQEPAVVKALHLLHHLLEKVIQDLVGDGQAAVKAQMELTVVGVHLIVISSIGFPNLMRLRQMESGGMVMEELLHIGNLQQALIVAAHCIVPSQSSTLFDNAADGIHIDDIVTDVLHQEFQHALVDAGEALGIHQILHRHLHEAVAESCFVFHKAGNLIQALFISRLEPIGNHIIAVGLVGHGDKTVQTNQELGTHCPGRRG